MGRRKQPTWHAEALKQGVDYIVIVYDKADGFAFHPSSLDAPFMVGGDYNGAYPVDAQAGRHYFRESLRPAFRQRARWFSPFVDKVCNRADFSLRDLDLKKRRIEPIRGDWPW